MTMALDYKVRMRFDAKNAQPVSARLAGESGGRGSV